MTKKSSSMPATIIAALTFLVSDAALAEGDAASAQQEGDFCGITAASAPEAYEQISGMNGARIISQDDQFIAISVAISDAVWTFTKASNPAHPTAVCREVIEDEDGVHIRMRVKCHADKATCDVLVEAFQVQHEAIEEALRQNSD